jgi:hypothetical protein
VTTKMVSRLTPVDNPRPVAKTAMNGIAMPKRAFGLVVKFRAKIGPTIRLTLEPGGARGKTGFCLARGMLMPVPIS